MRFSSDAQRRAVFSNLNKLSLYIDKNTGRLRSTEYPQVDVKMDSKVDVEDIIPLLEDVGEENIAGLSKLEVVTRKKPIGLGGTFKRATTEEDLIERIEQERNFFKESIKDWDRHEYKFDEKAKELLRKKKKERPDRPLIRIRMVGDEDVDRAVVAHEVGHHVDTEAGGKRDPYVELPAEAMEEVVIGDWVNRKKRREREKEYGRQRIEEAIAIQEAKTPSYEELTSFISFSDLD
jgi:hypothetical protein